MHSPCLGTTARRASIFQDELCVSILQGLRRQRIVDGKMKEGEAGLALHRDGHDKIAQHAKDPRVPSRGGGDSLQGGNLLKFTTSATDIWTT